MTKVASVKVIALAAIIAIVIGFLGKFTALVSTIPNAVLGGVSLLLYGFIAVNGLKVLIKNQVNFENSKNVIVASSMLVLGLGGAAVGIVSGDVSVTISGMSLASIIGIVLNLFLKDDEDEEVEVVEEAPKKASKKEINELKDAIKNELTVELKAELIDEIKKELLKDKKETTKKVVKKTTKKDK
jgi:xanthine/uracil permease